MSRDWQVGFVCFAAAAETMLTYAAGPGTTRRLAAAYARLIRAQDIAAATERFGRLYSVRSGIVHGRSHDRKLGEQDLRDLGEFAALLREIWIIVLRASDVRMRLENDDERRRRFFASQIL